jgi:hypothetical protein
VDLFSSTNQLLRRPDVICQAQTIKDILGIALTDCFIDATQTVEPCFPPCYALYPCLYISIHPSLFSDIACSLAISTLSLSQAHRFLCCVLMYVQGILNHVLVFFVAVSLRPPLCRLVDATSSIERRPAASSSLSHSAHCSFVSPGWPSCHLITSASTLPVHWPGFCAPRIRMIWWPCE